MSRGTALRALAGAALVALAALAAAGLWGWRELHRPYAGWDGDEVVVVVEPGLDAGSMLARLSAAGVLRRPAAVRAWLALRGGAQRLHAGEYRFERPSSPLQVLRRLRAGDVLLHEVTIPEGLWLDEVARRFAEAGITEAEALRAAFSDPAPIADLDAEATDLEGYLFPETYRFPRGESASRVAAAMVAQFRAAVGPDFARHAAGAGLDVRQAVTLASMIERETSIEGERARISGVFHNRLARGMKLECDPTVIYALHRAGREVGRLTLDDLRFASPWNTYVVSGLPAGPIASPGLESLRAAVAPAEVEDLYFVAAPDGGHRFSRDLDSHHRAVAEWRRYLRSSR